MVARKFKNIQDKFSANLCNFAFKTPFPYLKTQDEQKLIKQAKDYFYPNRDSFYTDKDLGYTIHLWNPNVSAPKILICHGWMSRALYMSGIIKTFVQQGFEVHAMDFPAHGDAKGFQLDWVKAPECILDCQKKFGPYNHALGHSFGGTMILAAESAFQYVPHINELLEVEKVVLMGSPVRIGTPIQRMAKALKLRPTAEQLFAEKQIAKTNATLEELDGKLNINNTKSNYFLVHDTDDPIIPIDDAIYFCDGNPKATLHQTHNMGHVKPLYDAGIMETLKNFLL